MTTLINKIKLNENYNEEFADRSELTKISNLVKIWIPLKQCFRFLEVMLLITRLGKRMRDNTRLSFGAPAAGGSLSFIYRLDFGASETRQTTVWPYHCVQDRFRGI
ncbi:hypothetical protein TNCV_1160591 [Trichonephila clavipes]|nr:hypothetical protein TNCV_1160591 [Trichonephila clavipes]